MGGQPWKEKINGENNNDILIFIGNNKTQVHFVNEQEIPFILNIHEEEERKTVYLLMDCVAIKIQ